MARKAKADPARAFHDQIDPHAKTNEPKTGRRPGVPKQQAENDADGTAEPELAAVRQAVPDRCQQPERAHAEEQRRKQQG